MNTGIHLAVLILFARVAVFFYQDVEDTYLGFGMICLWMVWFWFTIGAVMDDWQNWQHRK